MGSKNDLSNRINESYSKLSKGQKLLATYITDNYDKAVFLTAAKLGEVVGVSESTVVRFAMHLGYRGYPEFQSALEELVRNKLNSIQRMEVTYGRISQSKILESVLKSDAEKINSTLEKIDQAAFEMAVDTIFFVAFCNYLCFDFISGETYLYYWNQKLCAACVVYGILFYFDV